MDLGLRERVAIVCAASQGLGKATALGLAREGAHVVMCSRDAGRLEAAAAEVRGATVSGARGVGSACRSHECRGHHEDGQRHF
jgi:3-oxoacyl-[acyl-carrier protein] reductase